MKRTLLALAITSLSLITTPLKTEAQSITVDVSYSCAAWAEIRNNGSPNYISEFWLSGLMTGLSLGSGNDLWGSLKRDQVVFWMDRYCDNNPLSDTTIGAAALMLERFGRDWAN